MHRASVGLVVVCVLSRSSLAVRLLLEQEDVPEPSLKPPFDPASCTDSTWVPYQRTWNEQPNSPGNFTYPGYPEYDLPMMCTGHSLTAPFLLIAANGHNKTLPDWLKEQRGLPYEVYHAEDKGNYHFFDDVANEAGAYLKYIAEHYDCLPDVTLFAHSHDQQTWHRSEPLHESLRRMRVARINGFAYLQRNPMWFTLAVRHPSRNLEGNERENQYDPEAGCGEVINGTLYWSPQLVVSTRSDIIAEVWDLFLGPAGLGPVPEMMQFSLGGEFLVTRERIHLRPRKFYVDALSFLTSYMKEYPNRLSHFELGVAWESVWHIIFGVDSFMHHRITPVCELYVCD